MLMCILKCPMTSHDFVLTHAHITNYNKSANSVTPFKFVAIKVRGFDIMTYLRRLILWFPIKIISRFPTQMLCFSTQIKVGTLCVKNHQVLRLEHRLGLWKY